MEDNCQKIKLLKLMELLGQETDEQHPLRTSEICARLTAMNISCERRTVTKDMALLNREGYEVMSCMVGHEKAYYVEDRRFSVPELKILMDAVQAASFITEKKTAVLTDKIAHLGGSHRAELLMGSLVRFNTRKHTNESVYYSVEFIEEAIAHGRRLSFYYFDLNENRERAYRKAHRRYTVDPIALVYSEDNYYLMCYSAKYHALTNYRVDRMDGVREEAEEICEEARSQRVDPGLYTEQVFRMFDGEETPVTLLFDDTLIGAVYDKFGEDTVMRRVDERHCEADLVVHVSPTFFGWLFQFGDKMRLRAPAKLIGQYRRLAEKVARDE